MGVLKFPGGRSFLRGYLPRVADWPHGALVFAAALRFFPAFGRGSHAQAAAPHANCRLTM